MIQTPLECLKLHLEHLQTLNGNYLSGESLQKTDAVFTTIISIVNKNLISEKVFLKKIYEDGKENGRCSNRPSVYEDWQSDMPFDDYLIFCKALEKETE